MKKKLYIAAVVDPSRPSKRTYGDWGAFISSDEKKVIQQATTARREWTKRLGVPEIFYKIVVGELNSEIIIRYQSKKIPLEVK